MDNTVDNDSNGNNHHNENEDFDQIIDGNNGQRMII